jgi:hypothetical protein
LSLPPLRSDARTLAHVLGFSGLLIFTVTHFPLSLGLR